MNICIVIPHFNHATQLPGVLESLEQFGLPIVLVDDGSDATSLAAVRQCIAMRDDVRLHELDTNHGKGGAIKSGLSVAEMAGYTHALQIDADGQHNISDVPKLVAIAEQYPDALVSGAPRFSDDMPAARRWGRRLTHACVAIETLSGRVGDAMCGFRMYPLKSVNELLSRMSVGDRMDFDIELMVKADWAGIPIRHFPTDVVYPETGVSHFHYLRDNVLITAMHTRLILGMVPRAPGLVLRWFRGSTA